MRKSRRSTIQRSRRNVITTVALAVLAVLLLGLFVMVIKTTSPDTNVASSQWSEPNSHCTYDVIWAGPNGVETWTGISSWCKRSSCHGGALHFVEPKTGAWISINGTYKCTRVDRVER